MHDPGTPIFDQLADEYRAGLGPSSGRHGWRDERRTPGGPMTEPLPESASDDEADDALASGVLSADDPATDETWPGIFEHPPGESWPDAFPDSWGAQGPTERDQAAIDSGASREATDDEVLG